MNCVTTDGGIAPWGPVPTLAECSDWVQYMLTHCTLKTIREPSKSPEWIKTIRRSSGTHKGTQCQCVSEYR